MELIDQTIKQCALFFAYHVICQAMLNQSLTLNEYSMTMIPRPHVSRPDITTKVDNVALIRIHRNPSLQMHVPILMVGLA